MLDLLVGFDTAVGFARRGAVVNDRTNEIKASGLWLDRIKPTKVLVAAAVLPIYRGHAWHLHGRGAHYPLAVRAALDVRRTYSKDPARV